MTLKDGKPLRWAGPSLAYCLERDSRPQYKEEERREPSHLPELRGWGREFKETGVVLSCCGNKLLQIHWLKTKQIHYLHFCRLEIQSGPASLYSFWGLQKNICFLPFPLSKKPPESLGSWQIPPSLKPSVWHPPVSFSVPQILQLSYFRTHGITLGPPVKFRIIFPSKYSYWIASTKSLCSHSFLQGIFPTQGSNSILVHCRQIVYRLSHQGSPIQGNICTILGHRMQMSLKGE